MNKIHVFLVLLFLPSMVFAGSLVCQNATVEHVAYHGNNKLMVQLSNMNKPVFFCSPESEWSVPGTGYVMGAESCKSVFSMFLAAKASGAVVAKVHFDGDQVPETCNSWGSWESAVIRYVRF